MFVEDDQSTLFYQQIVGLKSFPTALKKVSEHLQGLWCNIGINTISVASIRGQIQKFNEI
jgi:hypothetical protein